ncbi:MAG TPA: hypothetical protein VFY44_02905, partial [Thermoleophilaceae bacterium]|nr:hypothetical protein [Thermoleophilaceae bacterium]
MSAHAHHHEHEDIEFSELDWTDPKRHAWLLGLLVPVIPFIAWGLVEATGSGAFWFFGPVFLY